MGYGPSPAQKVGGMQWPGMAQMSKLKQREQEQKDLNGSQGDSPAPYLDTEDLSPNEGGSSGGTSPGAPFIPEASN